MRPSLLALSLMLLPAVSFADADPRFTRLRDDAVPLGSLYGFLEKYIGECTDLFAGRECKENAKKFRADSNGKKFYMIIDEDQAHMLSPGPYDPRGEYTVNIAPLFASGGYAVTHGAPKKTDAQGNPMMMYLQARGRTPPGWNAGRFSSLFRTRALRVQVVFTPEGIWELPKKGGKNLGVKAKIHAILVTIGRTGEPVGLWLESESGKASSKRR